MCSGSRQAPAPCPPTPLLAFAPAPGAGPRSVHAPMHPPTLLTSGCHCTVSHVSACLRRPGPASKANLLVPHLQLTRRHPHHHPRHPPRHRLATASSWTEPGTWQSLSNMMLTWTPPTAARHAAQPAPARGTCESGQQWRGASMAEQGLSSGCRATPHLSPFLARSRAPGAPPHRLADLHGLPADCTPSRLGPPGATVPAGTLRPISATPPGSGMPLALATVSASAAPVAMGTGPHSCACASSHAPPGAGLRSPPPPLSQV